MFCWTVHLNGLNGAHCAAVAVEDKLYAFGGYGDRNHIGGKVFSTVSLRWTKLPLVTAGRELPLEVPSGRVWHTAVLIEHTVYIWGGYPYCNVLFAFDVDTHRWSKPRVSGTVPEMRHNHSACVSGKVMYIHGGVTQLGRFTNDIYKLDTTTMFWSLINNGGTPPAASSGHSATIIGTKMFVFGGNGNGGDTNNIRVFDTETNHWLSTASFWKTLWSFWMKDHSVLLPERRRGHSAFAYNGELYILGGRFFTRSFNDLWRFNPDTSSWKKVTPKGKLPKLMQSSMCCCMVGDRAFLFGGNKSQPNDLFILDLSPSMKTLCKQAVIRYDLEQSELPRDIRWELAAMTTIARHSPFKMFEKS